MGHQTIISPSFESVDLEFHFELIWKQRKRLKKVQTTLIPAGGPANVDFRVEVPGTLIFVDHSIFRTFNKSLLMMLKVEGEPNATIYSGKQDDTVYLPEGPAIQRMVTEFKPSNKCLVESIFYDRTDYQYQRWAPF